MAGEASLHIMVTLNGLGGIQMKPVKGVHRPHRPCSLNQPVNREYGEHEMKSDCELRRDVLDELEWEPRLKATEIGVTAKGGIVTLSGTVDHIAERSTAERVARNVRGVKAVANELEVEPAGTGKRTDAYIARAVSDMVGWNLLVPGKDVKVTVSDGWVTLEGQADWRFQKAAVVASIKNMAGVKGLTDLLTIKPEVEPAEVEADEPGEILLRPDAGLGGIF